MAAPNGSCNEIPSLLTAAAVLEKEEICPQTGMQSCDQPRAFFFHPLMPSGWLLKAVRKRSPTDTSPGGRRRGSSSRESRAVVEVTLLPRLLCLVSSEPHCSRTSCTLVRDTGPADPRGKNRSSLIPLRNATNRLRNSVYISPCQPQISSFYFPF